MYGKEAASLVLGCDEFTDLPSFPSVGDVQMLLVWLSLAHSLFPVKAPGNWEHLPAETFIDNYLDGWVTISLDIFGEKKKSRSLQEFG